MLGLRNPKNLMALLSGYGQRQDLAADLNRVECAVLYEECVSVREYFDVSRCEIVEVLVLC